MKIEFDPTVDALYVRLNEQAIIESEEVQPGIVFDFDESGSVVGIEVLHVSRRTETPAPIQKAA